MRVIYLAAGSGSRLAPYTDNTQKCLLDINGKSIVEHFLDGLIYAEADVDTVHLVVGHHANKFKKLLGPRYKGLRIQYLRNALFRVTGACQSLYLAQAKLRRYPCLVLEGDHYLDPELLKLLIESQYENTILVDDNRERIKWDEETLAYGQDGLVTQLEWPSHGQAHLKPVGEALTIFNLSRRASSALSMVIEKYLLEPGNPRKEIIEPMNRLMAHFPIHYLTTSGKGWTEIDVPSDLEYARSLRWKSSTRSEDGR